MNLKEAKEFAKDLDDKRCNEVFCPLINGLCRKHCECFNHARIKNPELIEITVYPPYCSNLQLNPEQLENCTYRVTI